MQKTDCFLCSCAQDTFRFALATATLLRLAADDALNLTIIRTPFAALNPADQSQVVTVNTNSAAFQYSRRLQADIFAKSDPYIIADDDCLPLQDDFCERGLEIMGRHAEFAILGLRPITSTLHPWTPENYVPYVDDEVEEHVSVGNIYFIRQNLKVPISDSNRYDRIMADSIRESGKRVGLFKHLTLNHLGHNFSTLS